MPPIARYLHSDPTKTYRFRCHEPNRSRFPVLIATGIYGISAVDVPVGKTATLRIRGIFAIAKANPADSFAIGTMLEFNGTSGLGVGAGNGTFRVMAPCPAGQKKCAFESTSKWAPVAAVAVPRRGALSLAPFQAKSICKMPSTAKRPRVTFTRLHPSQANRRPLAVTALAMPNHLTPTSRRSPR